MDGGVWKSSHRESWVRELRLSATLSGYTIGYASLFAVAHTEPQRDTQSIRFI